MQTPAQSPIIFLSKSTSSEAQIILPDSINPPIIISIQTNNIVTYIKAVRKIPLPKK